MRASVSAANAPALSPAAEQTEYLNACDAAYMAVHNPSLSESCSAHVETTPGWAMEQSPT